MRDRHHVTGFIQCHKVLEYFDYSKAVAWALDLVEQGNESKSVLMLASFSNPIERFEISPYVSEVLKEFGLEELYEEKALIANVYYHLTEILNNNKIRGNLKIIYQLCLEYDYEPMLVNFYRIYYAWKDLEEIGENHYLEKVDLQNIEEVLKTEAKVWIDTYVDERVNP